MYPWAAATPFFPFVTIIKISTISRKGMAVMECPYTWNIMAANILKQHLKVKIIAMKRMKMNQIRMDPVNIVQKLIGCMAVEPSVQPRQPAQQSR